MDEAAISAYLSNRSRHKQLDDYREYIVYLLTTFPQLSAVKVQRKLEEKYPELDVSSRSIRRYLKGVRETVASKSRRYYQPVLDMVPGEQCQVDPGELRGVLINGTETTVYFVVFVLSFSRLMYVGVSDTPIDTERFIQMHDAAFRYFGGVTAECVYDQTKLVVIEEVYRELTVNARFNEYATHAGFRIQACEGYDPESKGKVEAGVKYVKGNALYGEVFASWADLEAYLADWLDNTANQRVHATTGEVPQDHYDRLERSRMKPYLSPYIVHLDGQLMTRKTDKTGLISYQSNKYSVPLAYQQATVGIRAEAQHLIILDLENDEEIARHLLTTGKGKVLKNTHHYRDPALRIEQLEQTLRELIGQSRADALSGLLKQSEPKIYKDQLAGVIRELKKHQQVTPALLDKLCQRPRLSATLVRDFLEAYQEHPERLAPKDEAPVSASAGQLDAYSALISQEVSHVPH
jgi:transposase